MTPEGLGNYAAAKAGMIGFAKSVAKEGASRGGCVNCVAPGFIKSDMTAVLPEKIVEESKKLLPMRRMGVPEEANYITGALLTVDGGMTM
jgi:3-oxoacyl-[acyl-carrier protein] reductase